MCLILLALDRHSEYPLILAGNRDEFYRRPTVPAEFWPEAPGLLAGRDLVSGGTWLGVHEKGRLAAIANYRDSAEWSRQALSRGKLAADYLLSDRETGAFLAEVAEKGKDYKSFNLLAGEGGRLFFFSNREGAVRRLRPGIYGLSNALLDTPWPKVTRSKAAFTALLERGESPDPEKLFAILTDTRRVADEDLPDTGVGLERERILSAPFIVSPDYGTRSSTVILVRQGGRGTFIERSYPPESGPERWTERRHAFRLDGW